MLMAYDNILIEVGKQTMIGEAGTTVKSPSQLHLRNMSPSSLKSNTSRSATEIVRLAGRLEEENDTDRKFDLLSKQFQEVSKMLMLLISVGLDD